MQDELSALFGGRPVDLVTPKFLNHRIRDEVLRSAQVRDIVGMRHKIVHDYLDIDFDVVWEVVTGGSP